MNSKDQMEDQWEGALLLQNAPISEVETFKHLGVQISASGKVAEYIKRRVSATYLAIQRLDNIGLTDNCVSLLTKVELYNIYVKQLVTNG